MTSTACKYIFTPRSLLIQPPILPDPQNWNFKSVSLCDLFLSRNDSKLLLQKTISTATQIVELNPLIHLTTLILDLNQTQSECYFYSRAHFYPHQESMDHSTRFSHLQTWTSRPVNFPSSLPYTCMLHSVQTSMKVFSMLCICYRVQYMYMVPLCSLVEMVDWSKLQGLFLKPPFLDINFSQRKNICLCISWGCCSKTSYDEEKRPLCAVFFTFHSLGCAYLLCKHGGFVGLQFYLW